MRRNRKLCFKITIGMFLISSCCMANDHKISSTSQPVEQISSSRCYYLLKKGHLDDVLKALTDPSNNTPYPKDLIQKVAETIIINGLTSNNSEMQLAALYGTSLSGDSDLIKYARDGLESGSLEVQMAATSLIGSGNHKEGEYLLRGALRSDYFAVRLEALWIISILRNQNAFEQLEALYAKVPDEIRLYLLPLFALEGSTRAQDFLSHVLRSSDVELQAQALMALATIPLREKSPLKNPPFLDPLTLEAFMLYALSHRDCVPQETIEHYAEHHNPFVRLSAQFVLAHGEKAAYALLEAQAKEMNPFAISLLGKLPLSDASPLFSLATPKEFDIPHLQAGLALLAHKRPECTPLVLEIIRSASEEAIYRPRYSPGRTMIIWEKIPTRSLLGSEKLFAIEQSLRFREEVLIQSINLPEKQFLQIADHVMVHAQDLIPLLCKLLENKQSEKVREWLKQQFQDTSSLLGKMYVAKSLTALGEVNSEKESPWKKTLVQFLKNEQGLNLFQPRPLIPWFMQAEPKPQELTFDERARLCIESLYALISAEEPETQTIILEWMSKSNSSTRTLLAGILGTSCL